MYHLFISSSSYVFYFIVVVVVVVLCVRNATCTAKKAIKISYFSTS